MAGHTVFRRRLLVALSERCLVRHLKLLQQVVRRLSIDPDPYIHLSRFCRLLLVEPNHQVYHEVKSELLRHRADCTGDKSTVHPRASGGREGVRRCREGLFQARERVPNLHLAHRHRLYDAHRRLQYVLQNGLRLVASAFCRS